MPTNKEIQERITQELKPDISFEEFCESHGIEYTTQRRVTKKSTIYKKVLIPMSTVAAVALCIGLPFAFKNKQSDDGMVLYGDSDVLYEVVQSEALLKDKALLAFDLTKSESYSEIRRVFPTAKTNLTVGYTIKTVLYGFEYESCFYAYEFDYIVRCYKGYNFSDIDRYTNSSNIVYGDETEFKYTIEENNDEYNAYITFKKGGYDYYINLRGYEDMTEINSNNVEVFIKNVF